MSTLPETANLALWEGVCACPLLASIHLNPITWNESKSTSRDASHSIPVELGHIETANAAIYSP